jgi:mRNA interferase HicA
MKRVKPIKILDGLGCEFVRHGAKHDWYSNPRSGASQPVPRHREINERLARHIIRMLEDEDAGLVDRTSGDESA